ncbi:carboxymuconolactone decarboxylase family protein [Breoghania sp.]|uniref:carboxymuconolactone decarboxylase family protein n=1 Tax=Breoghania sp. TaxID=2065378 RepID=UPI00262CC0F3|nr:carboxymuconolactone decarboxylase family protein [Breoghania sp.]MDJ0931332.1 carboxymuconolactone decarboxylase family protein [Breoghania sp.]
MGTTPYPEITKAISKQVGVLTKEIPETMAGFRKMVDGVEQDGALDKKTKELIAMGIAIALRCDGCIGFHSRNLVQLGATRQEYEEMLGIAIYMGGGPSLMYSAQAMDAWEQFGGSKS